MTSAEHTYSICEDDKNNLYHCVREMQTGAREGFQNCFRPSDVNAAAPYRTLIRGA